MYWIVFAENADWKTADESVNGRAFRCGISSYLALIGYGTGKRESICALPYLEVFSRIFSFDHNI